MMKMLLFIYRTVWGAWLIKMQNPLFRTRAVLQLHKVDWIILIVVVIMDGIDFEYAVHGMYPFCFAVCA